MVTKGSDDYALDNTPSIPNDCYTKDKKL